MKRVVFYARVSTESNVQLHSLEEQRKFFLKFINENHDYSFVGEYVDEGITGTSMKNRNAFNKMMRDALNHKFDLILVKDISRFSRNTLDTIEQVRLLKANGIDVIFLNDRIDTSQSDGELNLSLLATMAQDESRKNSNRVKWSMTNEMKNGRMYLEHIYGYDIIDGQLIINEEEAKVVKMIYDLYLQGLGLTAISLKLKDLNIKTCRNKDNWALSVISFILSNEKYTGDLATHKRSVDDYLTHLAVNIPKEEQYYFPNHHEAIIDKETFERVQIERKRRSTKKQSPTYNFLTGKLQCGYCGGYLRKNNYHKIYYTCEKHDVFQSCSNNNSLHVTILKKMLWVVLNDVFFDKQNVESKVIDVIKKSSSYNKLHEEKTYYEKRERTLTNKKNDILENLLEDKITLNGYQTSLINIERDLKELTAKLNELEENNKEENVKKTIGRISAIVKDKLEDESLLEDLVVKIVDKIVFRNRNDFDLYVNTNQYKSKTFDKNVYKYITTLDYDFSYLEQKYSLKKYKNLKDTKIRLYVLEG